MSRLTILLILFISIGLPFFFPLQLQAADFSVHRISGPTVGPTLLVIGGIDGDEPGGFHAAATLVTQYRLRKGSLIVVPNLNTEAIQKRVRGTMNLKFSTISEQDPQYEPVRRIKHIISETEVDMVLNLHDGSGFYHPSHIDNQRNPEHWGQCLVIDQAHLEGPTFGHLADFSNEIIRRNNSRLVAVKRHFQLKNAHTREAPSSAPAQKSLTFFAIRQGKPAIAIEASKEDPVNLRAYHHLLTLESVMDEMGISFSRDFSLTPVGVANVLKKDATIGLAAGRIQLDLNNMRDRIRHFPLPQQKPEIFRADNPLISLKALADDKYRIYYGNNRLAILEPLFVEFDHDLSSISMTVDDQSRDIPLGSIVPVQNEFSISPPPGYRVNVIGYTKQPGGIHDGDTLISRHHLKRTFSIDRDGRVFRAEIYRDKKFSGMILLDFRPHKEERETLMALGTREDQGGEKNN